MAKQRKDNGDQPDENQSNADDSADNFGLPDIEYKPLEREETVQPEMTETEQEPDQRESSRSTAIAEEASQDEVYEEEEGSSKAPIIIVSIIILVLIAGGFLLYKYVYVPKKEKEKQELAAKAAEKQKAEEEAAAKQREEAERKRLEDEAAAKKTAVGTIETLSDRTRRYYVVVTSDIDDDLVMDYAKKLSAKGVSSKIIPPYGNYKWYRLTIADFDSFGAAQSSADASKAEYGDGLWVIKY